MSLLVSSFAGTRGEIKVVVAQPSLAPQDLDANCGRVGTRVAYRSNVVLDASFSSEIVTLSWPAYERLLRSLIPDEHADEALDIFAADVRGVLERNDERLQEFERELEKLRAHGLSPREKATKGARLVTKALPTMVGMGGLVGL